MDIEVAEAAAAGPEETHRTLDLVEQLADPRRLRGRQEGADRPRHAIGPHGDDLADLASLDPLLELLSAAAVADHQPYADLEVFLRRFGGQLQHLPRGGAVNAERLFNEDVDALLDRIAEVDPAEGRVGGEDRHVAGLQAVHRFAVRVEADELAVLGDVDLGRELHFQLLKAAQPAYPQKCPPSPQA